MKIAWWVLCFHKSWCMPVKHFLNQYKQKRARTADYRITVNIKLPKLGVNSSWKHKEVAINAEGRWEENDFNGY